MKHSGYLVCAVVMGLAGTTMGQCIAAPIGAMGANSSRMDMDSLAVGAVDAAAINAIGTPVVGALTNVTAPDKLTAAAGVYNTNVANGQGLARVGGAMMVIDNFGTAAFDATTFTFELDHGHTQFGVQVGDWLGSMVLNFFDGATLVATATSGSFGPEFFEVQGGCTFDRVELDVSTTGGNFVVNEVWTEEGDSGCYADCDGNGTLNVFDYICFGNAYSANDPYADCDGNGSFNVFDYICFGNAYALGCP